VRKSGLGDAASRSRARFCQGRRRTLRAMGDEDLGTRPRVSARTLWALGR
jgi:hypothetical protein